MTTWHFGTLSVALFLLACSSPSDAARSDDDRTFPSGTSSGGGGSDAGTDTSGEGTAGEGSESDTGEGSDGKLSGVETPGSGCRVPFIPGLDGVASLEENSKLPDPFTMIDGTKVTSEAQWVCRHREQSELLQAYELGDKPPRPDTVLGSMSDDGILVTVSDGDDNELGFSVKITYPETGSAPYPALIALGTASDIRSAVLELGVAVLDFDHNSMGNQSGSRGTGQFFDFHPGADAGALLAWSWGVSRLIDALEVTQDARIDATHLAVNGCSRNGKGALMVGALDARIALTIPQESGSGGVASWRVSQADADAGANVQTLGSAATEQPWFRQGFARFGSLVNRTPLDHHQVLAMVAPRGLFVIGNVGWEWLSRNSGNQSAYAAKKVFGALGVEDHIGHVESSHDHCAFPASEVPELQAFVRRFLLEEDVETAIWVLTDEEDASWVDWNVPTLR